MVWEVVLVPEGRGSPRSTRPSCRCRRSLPLTRRLCVLLPGGQRVPSTLERVPGRRDPLHARSQGAGIQRGPVMLPSFLLAGRGWQQRLCPLPVPWERCHGQGALPRRIPMLRGRAAPHRPPLSPQAGPGDICGRSWEALAALSRGGKLCTFPAGRQCLPEEHRQRRLRHKGCPRLGLAVARHHCVKGKGCRETCG